MPHLPNTAHDLDWNQLNYELSDTRCLNIPWVTVRQMLYTHDALVAAENGFKCLLGHSLDPAAQLPSNQREPLTSNTELNCDGWNREPPGLVR